MFEFDPHRRGKHHDGGHRSPRSSLYRGRAPQRQRGISIFGLVVVTVIALFFISQFVSPIPGCSIKGNISYQTGERIYHVPGQEGYSQARISFFDGERWFCSEEAARAAGWRRAFR